MLVKYQIHVTSCALLRHGEPLIRIDTFRHQYRFVGLARFTKNLEWAVAACTALETACKLSDHFRYMIAVKINQLDLKVNGLFLSRELRVWRTKFGRKCGFQRSSFALRKPHLTERFFGAVDFMPIPRKAISGE